MVALRVQYQMKSFKMEVIWHGRCFEKVFLAKRVNEQWYGKVYIVAKPVICMIGGICTGQISVAKSHVTQYAVDRNAWRQTS